MLKYVFMYVFVSYNIIGYGMIGYGMIISSDMAWPTHKFLSLALSSLSLSRCLILSLTHSLTLSHSHTKTHHIACIPHRFSPSLVGSLCHDPTSLKISRPKSLSNEHPPACSNPPPHPPASAPTTPHPHTSALSPPLKSWQIWSETLCQPREREIQNRLVRAHNCWL